MAKYEPITIDEYIAKELELIQRYSPLTILIQIAYTVTTLTLLAFIPMTMLDIGIAHSFVGNVFMPLPLCLLFAAAGVGRKLQMIAEYQEKCVRLEVLLVRVASSKALSEEEKKIVTTSICDFLIRLKARAPKGREPEQQFLHVVLDKILKRFDKQGKDQPGSS